MAARTRKIRHDDETRARIKTSQLINRLTKHAFGEVQLSSTQVRAIEILLGKTLPNLAQIEHAGSVETRFVAEIPSVAPDSDSWQQQHVPPQHRIQ